MPDDFTDHQGGRVVCFNGLISIDRAPFSPEWIEICLQSLVMRLHHNFYFKVVIVTHAYEDRVGVRYLSNFLKVHFNFYEQSNSPNIIGVIPHLLFVVLLFFQVYYLPFTVFYNQCALPTMFTTLPLMRDVCMRENITILHGHSVSL